MKKFILALTLLFVPICLNAETIKGRYCYTYGDNETLIEAKELTKSLAIRNAIESYEIYLTSSTKVTDFKLTNDIIQVLSSGYLNNISTLEHTENNRTICNTIQAEVSAKTINKVIQKEISKRTTKIELEGITSNSDFKILRIMESDIKLPITNDDKIVSNILNPRGDNKNIKVIFKSKRNFDSHNAGWIYIDYYDSANEQIPGDKKKVIDAHINEVNSVTFSMPSAAMSYRVWLQNEGTMGSTKFQTPKR